MAKDTQFSAIVFWIMTLVHLAAVSCGQSTVTSSPKPANDEIICGADQPEVYIPFLRNKKVAVVANQTSMSGQQHLVDILVKNKIQVMRVFAPEHGFRGEAGPGDKIDSGIDQKTGLTVVSVYGSMKRPSHESLSDLDVVIFDIQDVGARFYTYISTLHYMMEACASQGITVMVLDRPNPNGFYVDGPVLEPEFRSFVGIATIPVVHGLTVGEYALMANGEGWLENSARCDLKVIPVKGYNHKTRYSLPVPPSPNLQDDEAVCLYPSLCLFEGTIVSVGRGTDKPFHLIGYPGFNDGTINFTPKAIPGVINNPPYEGIICSGVDVSDSCDVIRESGLINLHWLIKMYHSYSDKEKFFNSFFDKLAGTSSLREQIRKGMNEYEIRQSWEDSLKKYKQMRKNYLLYQ